MRRIVSVEDYYDAALDLLVTGGSRSIKVGSLCAALGVTTGSFYGYFRGLDDFTEALLTTRLSRQNSRLFELAELSTQPEERVAHLRELARTVPHRAEAALRTWAAGNPTAAALQHRLDQERVAAVTEILQPVVSTAEAAGRLAEVGMALLVGWQHLHARNPGADFGPIFDQFEAIIWLEASRVDADCQQM
jgi:AcrR family transcriptional regulator